MQRNFERFLGPVFKRATINRLQSKQVKASFSSDDLEEIKTVDYNAIENVHKPLRIPPEFNGRDYVSFLLTVDAEIEHGLMLQYLYAAYSLGGPQVPPEHHDKVQRWQEIILGIAKEEMGHFISIQNVLKLIGSPLHFERQDYPWDTPFYPFPFKLEKLTLDSLAKYIYAEAPEKWLNDDTDQEANEIKARVKQQTPNPHSVGALFEELLEYIKDPMVIPDEYFQAETYPLQAKFDEWGRGYDKGRRGNTKKGNPEGSPDVLVMPLASRDDAYNVLSEIAEQGEATNLENDQLSHFMRFLTVYREMKDATTQPENAWSPSRNVATNPAISSKTEDPDASPSEDQSADQEIDYITNQDAINWGHLFNIRYRMLLNFLAHSFLLDNGYNSAGRVSARGMIINSTFGEMYNLRAIASVLVQLPLSDTSADKFAGPPFLVPYTLTLPMGEHNRWRGHKDLIQASATMIRTLLITTDEKHHRYLNSVLEADERLLQLIDEVIEAAV
jgi:hypothetical protein